jgi:uncharacterized membrane protein
VAASEAHHCANTNVGCKHLTTMKKDLVKKLIIGWTAIMLIRDIMLAIQADKTIDNYWLILVFILVDGLVLWTAYKMLKGKQWALIILMIYFGLRTISIYTDSFSFYITSGLNVEILISKTIGISLTSLTVFILLAREFNRYRQTTES